MCWGAKLCICFENKQTRLFLRQIGIAKLCLSGRNNTHSHAFAQKSFYFISLEKKKELKLMMSKTHFFFFVLLRAYYFLIVFGSNQQNEWFHDTEITILLSCTCITFKPVYNDHPVGHENDGLCWHVAVVQRSFMQ